MKVGLQIEEELLEKMQLESEYTHALDRAMTYLSGSAKTKKQVREYLNKKGYTELLVNKVLEKLEDYRFLNDELYAERYAEITKGNKGKYLIARELKAKGIDDKTAKKVLEECSYKIKTAVLHIMYDLDYKDADILLNQHNGVLRKVFDTMNR